MDSLTQEVRTRTRIIIYTGIDTYCEIDINIGSNTSILLRVGIVMGRNKKLKYARTLLRSIIYIYICI